MLRRTFLVASLGLVLSACAQTSTPVAATQANNETPPNIIFLIGDGMGFEYISAYRYAISERGQALTPTPFDEMLVGAATTYPDDDTWVTDSAAGATALATGVKSYNGAIGVDADEHPQQTVMEKAREMGWHTGAVSTSQVTHATPASFFTHHPSRSMYNAIADSFATTKYGDKWSFDVLLGGGMSYFDRADKNWLPELEQQGMHVVDSYQALEDSMQLPVLGLFAPVALPYSIDDQPRLAQLTRNALRLLSNAQAETGKPFALMVEGSKIDWCGHANDIACLVGEMQDFAQALTVARAFQSRHPNTLIVVTADHSTGGLTLGQGGVYEWHAERVMAINNSLEVLVPGLLERPRDEWQSYLTPRLNLTLSEAQWQRLLTVELRASWELNQQQRALRKTLASIISEVTRTGWTTTGHTAVDVPIMASGPQAEQLRGYKNNTDIGQLLLQIVR
ncbi:Alkaline phosphatase 3 [Pseudidiomarina piscicola]|uniref:Alkaline phosphatase 3 n=1 Tax=Pseudidiomarina piscicola TaxID=2614830 RepID=A0A6S6WM45_9GAMM|nr:alkaline phosphatase [Pseudidiomarina piscicola]CAB0150271.1 Alkaline phosphatase 3 [Pseudidiomarina piscicola]VZT39699.1 Alkaline phosphatase 3 [Pseudomonas aeruginosa]